MPKNIVLPVLLVLALSACNPRQDTPPVVEDPTDTNLITEAPLGNYDGGDEKVYFLAQAPDGTPVQFEVGFIKDGKLTITADDPPVELQQPWFDTLPEGITGLEYSEGAEGAMVVHVTAILIGDTGLMVTGSSGLAAASSEGDSTLEFAGITWSSAYFDASYYLQDGLNEQQFEDYTAFGLDDAGNYSNQSPENFLFNASDYLNTYYPEGGLPHPYFPPAPPTPDPGDEEPLPQPVTHQVDYYTGPARTVSVQTSLLEGGVASFPIGTINTAGLMTLDLSTPAPSEYLLPLSDAFLPGSFTNPDASILIPLDQFAFIIDDTPLTRFLAVDSMTMSSRGFYMYADQAVNINVPLEMPGLMPADLQLQAGWNFVTPESRDEGEILVNGDPQDFSWLALTMPPEPQLESITLSPEEWTGRPGGAGRVLSVQAQYDDGSDELVYSDITWISSDENIARIVQVDHEFAVQPVSYGTAIITAEWEGFTATMTAVVDTVITDTAPPHNVDVWAVYPVADSSIAKHSLLGMLTNGGHLTFSNIEEFELTPITETRVINAAYADDQDANLVFVQSISTSIEGSALWIGDPVNDDRSPELDNTIGYLWYTDRPVNITHAGPDTENTYDVSLATGWNLVAMTSKTTSEGGGTFHFENAPMNALPWRYEE